MFKFISKCFYDLLYENGQVSLTRFLSCVGYLAFIGGSFYMLSNNINWDSYDVFAAYTGGCALGLQFGNKFINSKYNSAPGSYKQNDPNVGSK